MAVERQETKRGGALSPVSSAVAPACSSPSPNPTASAHHRSRSLLTCVLHVTPGSELALCRRVAKVAAAHLTDCYVPQSQLPMRIQGVWEFRDTIVFPGYIFLETPNIASLEADLALITDYNRLLRTDGGVSVLAPAEVEAVRALCGPDHYIPTSWGVIESGQLRVARGPLQGRESTVIKIDRHKRCAWVKAGVLGRASVRVGLEVPCKT